MPQLDKFTFFTEHCFLLVFLFFAIFCMVFLFVFAPIYYLFKLLNLYSKILREVLEFNKKFGEPICFKFSWKEGVEISVQKGERGKPGEAKEADKNQKNQTDMNGGCL